MILYFDTETTGLHPGQICQLSYILQTKEKVVGKNFFFTVDYVEPSAQMVHGFSKQKLEFLSNGKRFADFFDQIKTDFENADLIVAHNVAFDFSFMRTEYERLNQVFKVKNEFCSMKKTTPICCLKRSSGNGYKYPKLQELCAFSGVSDSEIQKVSNDFYGQDIGFHDARFDTIAVYLCVNKLIQKDVFGELGCYL
ncbi:MAG: 3'-5' exonuclease [Clostridiales bacterium]|nr:3'-5' exonuclease [Clostridiales bacterium]